MKVGIISYLPSDSRRNSRILNHKTQLEWIQRNILNAYIVVVAQNYEDCDYSDLVDEYIKIDHPIGPGAARNILLNYLYDSNDDWMVLMDDNKVLDDFYDGVGLINYIDKNPDCVDLDMIVGINPLLTSFKFSKLKNKEKTEKYWSFGCGTKGMQVCLFRNLNKKYNKKIYQVDDKFVNGSNIMHEDIIFSYDMIYNGFKLAACTDMIYKHINLGKNSCSTAFNANNISESAKMHNNANYLTKLYLKEKFNVPYTDDFLKDISNEDFQNFSSAKKKELQDMSAHISKKWMTEHNKYAKEYKNILIQRPTPYIFKEKELKVRRHGKMLVYGKDIIK